MKKFYTGFTLAEVLTTIGVIGVIAAITMPGLINKTNDKEIIAKVKKEYSVLQNMAIMYKAQNSGAGLETLFVPGQSHYLTLQGLSKYMRMQKLCTNNSCWIQKTKYATPRNNGYGSYNTYFTGNGATGLLADGASISVGQFSGDSSCAKTLTSYKTDSYGNYILDANNQRIPYTFTHYACADLVIDANGPKPPNQFGVDTFFFVVYPDRIFPYSPSIYGNLNTLLTSEKFTATQFDPATYGQ